MKRFSFLLLFVCVFSVLEYSQTCISSEAKNAVNKIKLIENLPIKKGEPFVDLVAVEILKFGKCASPFLADKLSNNSKSKVSHLFNYKIGQVALFLLNEIYKPLNYPCPDSSCVVTSNVGDYRDFVQFFQVKKNRQKLKLSWNNYIK